jgi:hypothetical protein
MCFVKLKETILGSRTQTFVSMISARSTQLDRTRTNFGAMAGKRSSSLLPLMEDMLSSRLCGLIPRRTSATRQKDQGRGLLNCHMVLAASLSAHGLYHVYIRHQNQDDTAQHEIVGSDQ